MFLEILTFIMLILVLALKYGTVTRMVKLNQRLRDAEAKCKRVEERLKQFRNERRLAEREETSLTRQQISLEGEVGRMEKEIDGLKTSNEEVLQELTRTKGPMDLEEDEA